MYPDAANLALALLLVLINAFFVIAELAMVRVRLTRLDELASRRPDAARARTLARQIGAYLSACQLGVTLASLGLGWIGEPAFARAISGVLALLGIEGEGWVRGLEAATAFVLITALHIVIGELAPKTLAIHDSERLALAVSGPMFVFFSVTRPFVRVLNGAANAVVRLLGVEPVEEEQPHSAAELRALLRASPARGLRDTSERDLLENAFDFPQHTVRQVARPRGEVVFLSLAHTLEQTLATVQKSGYTRFPLCTTDLDEVIGMVHVKDLLFPPSPLREPKDLLAMKRPVLFIPENVGIVQLLTQMRSKRQLMALPVDEYGVVSGVCTMEDVLEQLVGEIQDEHDHEQPQIRASPTGEFLVDGTMLTGDVNRRLMLDLEAPGCDTISGLVVTRLGRLPRPGDTLIIDNYSVTVVEVIGFRAARLAFAPVTDPCRAGALRPSPA